MNIFGLDISQIDLEEARNALSVYSFNRLPGVPSFLSKKECAVVLGVSMKVINQLIQSGEIPLIDIPGDSQPIFDLFNNIIEPQHETCILRADLLGFIEKSLLCNKPVIGLEEDR
jgi:hypothetical protein